MSHLLSKVFYRDSSNNKTGVLGFSTSSLQKLVRNPEYLVYCN